jgi:hypothetical protein
MSSKKEITKDQLDSFCSITGSTNERAQFFLEAANGDLDVRFVILFYFFFLNAKFLFKIN